MLPFIPFKFSGWRFGQPEPLPVFLLAIELLAAITANTMTGYDPAFNHHRLSW